MLYVGHFSFPHRTPDGKAEDAHGFLTLLVDADDVDVALAKFKRFIRNLLKQHEVFAGIEEIYLDTCIHVRSIPRKGLLTHVTIRAGEDIGGISASIIGAGRRTAIAYGWGEAGEPPSSEPRRMEPFLRLRKKKAPSSDAATEPTVPPTKGSESIH